MMETRAVDCTNDFLANDFVCTLYQGVYSQTPARRRFLKMLYDPLNGESRPEYNPLLARRESALWLRNYHSLHNTGYLDKN